MENLSATDYFQSIRSSASEEIKNKALDRDSVRGYIRHLPIRGDADCDGWGEEVLDISDKCLHELWEYSKEMGFIGKDFPYDKFIRRKF